MRPWLPDCTLSDVTRHGKSQEKGVWSSGHRHVPLLSRSVAAWPLNGREKVAVWSPLGLAGVSQTNHAMAHQLGEPLPGAPPPFQPQQYSGSGVHNEAPQQGHESMDELEGNTRVPRNCPKTHPWCSVPGCTERPLRQCQAASGNQVCKPLRTAIKSI